jgi:hypothetical protein
MDDILKIGKKKPVETPDSEKLKDLEKVKEIIYNVSQKERIFKNLYFYIETKNVDFDNGIKLFLYSESAKIYVYSSCDYDISDIIKIGKKENDKVTEIDEKLIQFFIEKGKPTNDSFFQNWRYDPGPIVPALDSPPANNAPNDASFSQNWHYDPGHRVTDFPILTREERYSGCVRSSIKPEFDNFNNKVKKLLTNTSLIVNKPQPQSHQYTPQPYQYHQQSHQYRQPKYQQDEEHYPPGSASRILMKGGPPKDEQSLDRLSALRDSIRARGQELQKKYPYPVQQSLQQPQPQIQSQCPTIYKITDDINVLLDDFLKTPDGVLCLIKEALDNKEKKNGEKKNGEEDEEEDEEDKIIDEKITDLLLELYGMNDEGRIKAETFNQIKLLNTRFNRLQFHGGKKSRSSRSKSHKKSRKQRRKSS